MSVSIIFESHGATADNENGIASGWNDPGLSELGKEHAQSLGARRGGEHFDAVFCSDLRRSYEAAEIAFGGKFPVVRDARLRECNYGSMNGLPEGEVKPQKAERVSVPFPNGESYEDAARRMKSFLDELRRDYDGKRVMIVGHRATQYGLEHLLKGVPLKEAITAPWAWRPGWEYQLGTRD